MTYDKLLLRFGEFTLKGKNRNRFERSVLNHIRSVLKPFPGAKIVKEYGRLYVELNGESPEALIHVLKKYLALYPSVQFVYVLPSLTVLSKPRLTLWDRRNWLTRRPSKSMREGCGNNFLIPRKR